MDRTSLRIGTWVVATAYPSASSTVHIGMITYVLQLSFLFWKQTYYLCSFAGKRRAVLTPHDIVWYNNTESEERKWN